MSQAALPDDFDLARWLESLGLSEYAAQFAENRITRGTLGALSDDDLKSIGVRALAHRKQLLAAIAELASSSQAETTPAAQPPAPLFFAPPPGLPPPLVPETPARSQPHAAPEHLPVAPTELPSRKSLWAKIIASKFLFVSIVAHLLFGLGATYYVVQRVQAKRKLTFRGGPPSTNPSKRALEHKVSMAKKKTGGAPPQARRIVSAGVSKVSLPEMPSMTSASSVVANMASGMGGAGTGQGVGFGSGMGGGMGGGGGGGGMSFFGFRGASKSIVFVIDISGSMISGKKERKSYDRLEREVVKALTALDSGAKFNIIAFSGQAHSFAGEMTTALAPEKERAIKWLKDYSPCNALPRGVEKGNGKIWVSAEGKRHSGTSSEKAIKRAFALKPDMIMFVSDGEPTDSKGPEVIRTVSKLQENLTKKVVINAVAYMADSGHDFMSKLAKANGGDFKNIR